MDVRTVAAIYCQLLECDAAIGETVNICSGRAVALREIIDLLATETGHQMEISVNPKFVRARELRRLVGSPEKLRSLVGEVPEIAFRTTLREMLEQD
jgi:nucleoside-diphosphate-sugar epimerase